MAYRRLSREERFQIYALLKAGHSESQIASVLGRSRSTINRELIRNRGGKGYRPKQAQRFADSRKPVAQRRIDSNVWKRVEELLTEDWSPEQICGWLREAEGLRISHEWIYQYIYENKKGGGNLYTHLRCKRKRRKRQGTYNRRGKLVGCISIEERPNVVDERTRIGDWELDTVIGKAGGAVLVTMVERVTRLTCIAKTVDKTSKKVREAITRTLKPIADRVVTLTYDNGKEFAQHAKISKELDASGYFAHPYHAWERGLNENTNGLIRQYVPKGCDIGKLTEGAVQAIENKLNNRPRKCLGFQTPNQVFHGIQPPVALAS